MKLTRIQPYVILGLACLLIILHFFLMLCIGVITTPLRTQLHLTAFELSLVASSYMYVYICMQTPAGILMDRFGPRILLSIGALVAACGCWMFSNTESLATAMLSRVITGAGLSFAFVGCIQLSSRWFDERLLGVMVGLVETAGMLGALIGNMFLAVFISELGWRKAFETASIFAIVMSVLIWTIVRDAPKNLSPEPIIKTSIKQLIKNLKKIVVKPSIWNYSAYIGMLYMVITVYAGLWANPFLREVYNFTLPQATLACSMTTAGLAIGAPIAGLFLGNTKISNRLILFTPVCLGICILSILHLQIHTITSINLTMLLIGLAASVTVLPIAMVSAEAVTGTKSTSVGFSNTIAPFIAMCLNMAIGYSLNMLSDTTSNTGLEIYTEEQYQTALTLIPVLAILATIPAYYIVRAHKVK